MYRNAKHSRGSGALLAQMDFPLVIAQEKIPGRGEDSYVFYAPDLSAAAAAVFDGLGGSGSTKYPGFSRMSGAYVASRAVSGAFAWWFYKSVCSETPRFDADKLKQEILSRLKRCEMMGRGASGIKGSLIKKFPTTMAAVIINGGESQLLADCLWAGDSRCYLLTPVGLMQLSEDDSRNPDPMQSLISDSPMTNVISLSKDFRLNRRSVVLEEPCIVFSATDGCFGYFSTPMEFEYLLLSTLLASASPEGWESAVTGRLREISGDDFTLCGYAFGFGDFRALKESFRPRAEEMFYTYIKGMEEKSLEEKVALWGRYKSIYGKWMKGAESDGVV